MAATAVWAFGNSTMPELRADKRQWQVVQGANLLDALNAAGVTVPYSCRAGSCHACLVRCLSGEPEDARPEALARDKRAEGWRLACQCRVVSDLHVEAFDPRHDGLPANVLACDWLSPTVLRLRLLPERPLRYRTGQHLVLWASREVARPYSLASLPSEERFLEFHIDCRDPGQFAERARQLSVGDELRLGELRGGALRYDADWQDRPLWLLAGGTGLAPLWGLLRDLLRQGHQGPIRLLHVVRDPSERYLEADLRGLGELHGNLDVQWLTADSLADHLPNLRPTRQTIALLCGSPTHVELLAKRLFLAGLPRGQVLADAFVERVI